MFVVILFRLCLLLPAKKAQDGQHTDGISPPQGLLLFPFWRMVNTGGGSVWFAAAVLTKTRV